MTAATKTPARRAASTTRRKAPKAAAANGNGVVPNGVVDGKATGFHTEGEEPYQPPTLIRPPEEVKVKADPKVSHPVYGTKALFTYKPKDGSDLIEFPHISTCRPTALFFYDNRNLDEMHQAFAWMDLCGIPDGIGRRLFMLPDEEQGALLREWFSGLNLTPAPGVEPPGES
jgi:hypothetical protein